VIDVAADALKLVPNCSALVIIYKTEMPVQVMTNVRRKKDAVKASSFK